MALRLIFVFLFGLNVISATTEVSEVLFEWVSVDYVWPNETMRQAAIDGDTYVVENNVITGLKVFGDHVFLTVPRWRHGVPSTLNYVTKSDDKSSPLLTPFPSWEANKEGDCDALQYVQSMEIDTDGVMWVIDCGRRNFYDGNSSYLDNTCPPKIVRYDINDLNNVKELSSHVFPNEVASHTSNFINDIAVDTAAGLAYISEAANGALITYQILADGTSKSKRWEDASTKSDPSVSMVIGDIDYGNSTFTNPTNGIALTPDGERVYYCQLQGLDVFSVSTQKLRDFDKIGYKENVAESLITHGQKHAPSDGMTFGCDGQLFYGGLTTDSLYSWNAIHDFFPTTPLETGEVVSSSRDTIHWLDTFAFDDSDSSMWFTTNKLDLYVVGTMDFTTTVPNMRVLRANLGVKSYLNGLCVNHISSSMSTKPSFWVAFVISFIAVVCLK